MFPPFLVPFLIGLATAPLTAMIVKPLVRGYGEDHDWRRVAGEGPGCGGSCGPAAAHGGGECRTRHRGNRNADRWRGRRT